jgi:hypothetical protein
MRTRFVLSGLAPARLSARLNLDLFFANLAGGVLDTLDDLRQKLAVDLSAV